MFYSIQGHLVCNYCRILHIFIENNLLTSRLDVANTPDDDANMTPSGDQGSLLYPATPASEVEVYLSQGKSTLYTADQKLCHLVSVHCWSLYLSPDISTQLVKRPVPASQMNCYLVSIRCWLKDLSPGVSTLHLLVKKIKQMYINCIKCFDIAIFQLRRPVRPLAPWSWTLTLTATLTLRWSSTRGRSYRWCPLARASGRMWTTCLYLKVQGL